MRLVVRTLPLLLLTTSAFAGPITFYPPWSNQWSVGYTGPNLVDALEVSIMQGFLDAGVTVRDAGQAYSNGSFSRYEIHITENADESAYTVEIYDWQGVEWNPGTPPVDWGGPAGPPNIIDTQNFSQPLTDEQLHSIGRTYADAALSPEPGTFLLGGLSLAAILWGLRRRIRAGLPEVFTSPVFTSPKKS